MSWIIIYCILFLISFGILVDKKDTYGKNIVANFNESAWYLICAVLSLFLLGIIHILQICWDWVTALIRDIKVRFVIWKVTRIVNNIKKKYNIQDE